MKPKIKVRDNIAKMRINKSSTNWDELEIAAALNTYFASIFTKDRTHIPNLKEKKYKRDIFIYKDRGENC